MFFSKSVADMPVNVAPLKKKKLASGAHAVINMNHTMSRK
jgi:hypothetical protein